MQFKAQIAARNQVRGQGRCSLKNTKEIRLQILQTNRRLELARLELQRRGVTVIHVGVINARRGGRAVSPGVPLPNSGVN